MRKSGIVLSSIGVLALILGIMRMISNAGKVAAAVSIIGGADGPTSVFIAGKAGRFPTNMIGIIVGLILIIVGVIIIVRKKK